MHYFLDTEFLEGTQKTFFGKTKPTIDLISIGVVTEKDEEYYAISKDFNIKEAWNRFDLKYTTGQGDRNYEPPTKVYWLRENVLKPLWADLEALEDISPYTYTWCMQGSEAYKFTQKRLRYLLQKYGKTNRQIAQEIKNSFIVLLK